MASTETFQISLPQFEGPFDLLLFFIKRDELDIYNIPIHKITEEYLDYLHRAHVLNMEQASEFILFASTLIQIKSRLLIPRKELAEFGEEIDPRAELVEKLVEYKRYKEASTEMALMEAERLLHIKRGNVRDELIDIGKSEAEDSEIYSVSLYKLMNAFEKAILKLQNRINDPKHVVVKFNYTLEGQRTHLFHLMKEKKKCSFEEIFLSCNNRIHAIFNFLAMLELIQQKHLTILIGEGRNSFILEWNGVGSTKTLSEAEDL